MSILVAPAFAADCRLLSGTGVLSASRWDCGRIPTDGDRATIPTGVTLTVDRNWTIGASGPNNSAAAIRLEGNAMMVAQAVTIRLRGDWIYSASRGAAPVAHFAGTRVILDSSQSGDPPRTWYRLGPDSHSIGAMWTGSNCSFSVDKTNGSLGGGFSYQLVPWLYDPSGRADHPLWGNDMNFDHCSFTGLTGMQHGIASVILTNNTFTDVAAGVFNTYAPMQGGATYIVTGNRLTSTTRYAFAPMIQQPKTGGRREFHDNVIESGVLLDRGEDCDYAGGLVDVNASNNYLGGGLCPVGGAAKWDYTFTKTPTGSGVARGISAGSFPAPMNRYNYAHVDITNADNPHLMATSGASQTVEHTVFESPDDVSTDSGEAWMATANPPMGTIFTLRNSIVLPSKTGHGTMELGAIFAGMPGARFAHEHVTWFGGVPLSGSGFGAQQLETGDALTGQVAAFRSNIITGLAPGAPYYKISPGNNQCRVVDVCVPANCDYNCGYKVAAINAAAGGCVNQGRGYVGAWSVTPGVHDLDALNGGAEIDPRFVDVYRTVALWDTRYLHNAYGPWSISSSYVYGALVQHQRAGFWNGLPVGFRCIRREGCPAGDFTTEPNVGPNWRRHWEFSSLYRVREAISGGTRYTDASIGCSGCYPVEALVRWVEEGMRPQNPSYCAAGHDGTTIGAVQCKAEPYAAPTPAASTRGVEVLSSSFFVNSGEKLIPLGPYSTNGINVTIYSCDRADCGGAKRMMSPGVDWYWDYDYTQLHLNRVDAGYVLVVYPPKSTPNPPGAPNGTMTKPAASLQDLHILSSSFVVSSGEHLLPLGPYSTNGINVTVYWCDRADCSATKRMMLPGIEWYWDYGYTQLHLNRVDAGYALVVYPPKSAPTPPAAPGGATP